MSHIRTRGDYGFWISPSGSVENCADNVELLRRLWIGRELVSGDDLGPGEPGDYDFGAWHVSCHLAAAGGVIRLADESLAWLEVSYDGTRGEYYGSCTTAGDGESLTVALDSLATRDLLIGSRVLGFVEGSSVGRISARGVTDPSDRFNGNLRQDYDQPPESDADGGKVWEHWCTLRDIRPSAQVGYSVLVAYLLLCSHLGDAFTATVARGRRGYGHPIQFAAMVTAGLIGAQAAANIRDPTPLPGRPGRLLATGTPESSLEAAGLLDWFHPQQYYMFPRRISEWNAAPVPPG